MTTRAAEEMLFNSETTLRLVDNVLDELQVMEAEVTRSEDRAMALANATRAPEDTSELPRILLRAYGEIQSVLESLKQSRHVLERTTVEKIHHTNDKLREVSSATEVAATDILDGLDRSLALVDDLEAQESGDQPGRNHAISDLRNELFNVMGHLQFQDITTQQLSYASSVLMDMESRMSQLAVIFDPAVFGLEPSARRFVDRSGPTTFDPAATTRDAERRQALVDEIFAIRR